MKTLSKIFISAIILVLSVSTISAKEYSFKVEVSGEGKDMILIPGLSCTGEVWKETVKHYKGDFRCHVITLPGFGTCSPVNFGESFNEFISKELINYVKEQKLDKPYIIGHSLGGFLALKLETQNPGTFAGLIIVDALPFLPAIMNPMATAESMKPMALNMKSQMSNRKKGESVEFLRPMMKSMTNDSTNAETILNWSFESDPKTVAQANYELYITDLRNDLEKAECPILVMGAWIAYKGYGVTHEITYTNYKNQYAKAKNATIKITDKGKHFIMWDDTDFFYKLSDNFLGKNQI